MTGLVLLPAIHDMERRGQENNENNKQGAITEDQEILEYSTGVSLVFMKHKWALFLSLLCLPFLNDSR